MIFDGIASVREVKNGGKEPKRESWASHARTTHNFLYLNGRADIIANGRRKQRLRNVMQSLSVRAEGIEGGTKDVRNLVRSNEIHNLFLPFEKLSREKYICFFRELFRSVSSLRSIRFFVLQKRWYKTKSKRCASLFFVFRTNGMDGWMMEMSC